MGMQRWQDKEWFMSASRCKIQKIINLVESFTLLPTIRLVLLPFPKMGDQVHMIQMLGLYCSDVAHTVQAPIFHVNADEPDVVDRVFQLAAEYRMRFKSDVVIDLIGYRRYGHNELDQPSFTQPIMYSKIKETPPCFIIYAKKLVDEGIAINTKMQVL